MLAPSVIEVADAVSDADSVEVPESVVVSNSAASVIVLPALVQTMVPVTLAVSPSCVVVMIDAVPAVRASVCGAKRLTLAFAEPVAVETPHPMFTGAVPAPSMVRFHRSPRPGYVAVVALAINRDPLSRKSYGGQLRQLGADFLDNRQP